ncbi:hypothetical protein [Sagittula salina]|uniref:Uncharacterized protein n=1 Tax=Sagittula salina TaxID=2820268 RepID=A0A940S4D1_9RHOB|nr:hypothetical protein [Sagittula salina]MBP0483964.1 hypothetical protein [Sagittula salina]
MFRTVAALAIVAASPGQAQQIYERVKYLEASCQTLIVSVSDRPLVTADAALYFDGMIQGAAAAGSTPAAVLNAYRVLCNRDPAYTVESALKRVMKDLGR